MVASTSRINPFPGIRPFELDEEHLFFGREGQADDLLTRLNRTRFLAVVGTSGSGKSSLVRAGLLPSLYSGFLQDASSGWRVAMLRPGSAPIANLAAALNHEDVFGVDPTSDDAIIRMALAESTLRRGSLGLVELTQQTRMAAHENLLVVVDQFEELFRLKAQAQQTRRELATEDEAAAFVKLLLAAVTQQQVPIFVVLTMRSDFLGDCAQFRDLPETLNDSQYLIPRLTRGQLQRAIEGPVAVGGATIAPRLVNRLLNDTGDNPDQLPILQHALMRTWNHWENQHTPNVPIDLEHYDAIGGMGQALSRHADQIYDGLPDDRCRQIAETLFKCLTDRGADNRDIRRPTPLADICAVANASPEDVIPIIDQFRAPRRSFLMPPPYIELHDSRVIDISHESLMRNWQQLKTWVTEEAQSAQIYRRLAETAALHKQGKAGYWRDPELTIGMTWRDEQKPNAVWAERYAPNFDEAIAFLEASAEAATVEAAEKENARKREVNRLRTFLGVFFGLALLSGGAAVYAFQQQNMVKDREAKLAQALDETQAAQQLAEERGNDLERSLEQTKDAQETAEQRQAEAEDAREIAEVAQSAEAEQRQLAEDALVRAEDGEAEANRQAAIARDQTRIADENAARAQEATTRAEVQALNAEIQAGALTVENLIAAELYSQALLSGVNVGRRIQSIESGNVQLAQADMGSLTTIPARSTALPVNSPINPSTRLQAVSALREVIYSNALIELQTLEGHSDRVLSVSFSPDGQTIASAS
ncbi:MAG: hypothetical protein AAGA75_18415, partial [Cyanobacteria bacterium P01_E01_bin.6]